MLKYLFRDRFNFIDIIAIVIFSTYWSHINILILFILVIIVSAISGIISIRLDVHNDK